MHEILTFAQTASPLAITAIAVIGLVYAIYKLSRGENILTKVSDTQDVKYPELTRHYEQIEKLISQNDTLLNNHFKHEIPDLINSVNRIESSVGVIQTEQKNQGERMTRVETLVEVLRGK